MERRRSIHCRRGLRPGANVSRCSVSLVRSMRTGRAPVTHRHRIPVTFFAGPQRGNPLGRAPANLDSNPPEFAEACRTLLARTKSACPLRRPFSAQGSEAFDRRRGLGGRPIDLVGELSTGDPGGLRPSTACYLLQRWRNGREGPLGSRWPTKSRTSGSNQTVLSVNLNHQFTMRAPRLLQIACVSGDQIAQCADHGDRVLYNVVPSVPYNCFGRKQL
jgi:hypothetical protein